MKQRLLLCLLLCAVMLYFAVPRLSFSAGQIEALFSGMWLLFVLFAIAGNITGILYAPIKKKGRMQVGKVEKKRMRNV
jgi:hypothetical protein